jgi:PKD repeat protein
MKNLSLILVAIPLLLISCARDPFADFIVSDTWVGVGEDVFFTNRSIDAESFEWNFGDGLISNSFNSTHYYNQPGDYTISLKAFNHGVLDVAEMNVTIGASLEITVEEYYEPFYLVTDISVILYPTVTDWENQTNMIIEGFTNSNGIVRFDHLYNQRYYVDVYGPNHDNYALAAENVDWIETPVLHGGTLNTFTAVVDYYPPDKKSTLSRFEVKAKRKIEAAEHAPRKKTDR